MLVNRNSLFGCVVAALALAIPGMPGDTSAQLANPGFESPNASGGDVPGTASWATFNQVFTTATIARSGSQCLKTFGPFFIGGGSGGTQFLPAAPGQTWVGEIWAINWSADPIDNVDFGVYKIEFLNSSFQLAAGGLAGVDIFESNPINASTTPDVWTKLGVGTAPAPAGTAYARAVIVKVDMDGAQGGSIFWDDAVMFNAQVGVPGGAESSAFDLLPNTPNPFGSSTRIGFSLRQPDHVDIRVYDVSGRQVATLLQAGLDAGGHFVDWDGLTSGGAAAPAGVYYYVMRTSAGQVSRRMIRMQ